MLERDEKPKSKVNKPEWEIDYTDPSRWSRVYRVKTVDIRDLVENSNMPLLIKDAVILSVSFFTKFTQSSSKKDQSSPKDPLLK